MKLLICDLDGVINGSSSVRDDLVPGIKTKSTFWAKWHKAHVREDINYDMLPLLRMYAGQGFDIAYLSNRQSECLDSTAAQLDRFPKGRLFLRHMLDDTPPPEYKARAVFSLVCYAEVNELVIIDDCAKNIAAIKRACGELVPHIYSVNLAKFTCNQ